MKELPDVNSHLRYTYNVWSFRKHRIGTGRFCITWGKSIDKNRKNTNMLTTTEQW